MKEQSIDRFGCLKPSRYGRLRKVPFLKSQNTDPLASAFGMAGAFVLATPGGYSRWGWICFLISNAFWIWSGIKAKNKSLLLQYYH